MQTVPGVTTIPFVPEELMQPKTNGDMRSLAVFSGRMENAQKPQPSVCTNMSAVAVTETTELRRVLPVDDLLVSEPETSIFHFNDVVFWLSSDLLTRCSLTKCFLAWCQELFSIDFDHEYLLRGIAMGFEIVPDVPVVPSADCLNYSSALEPNAEKLLDVLFREELAAGKLSLVTQKPVRVNAIGAVSKKGSLTPRPITDCSRPKGLSLNSFTAFDPFCFQTIDDVIEGSSQDCYYAVVDIKWAYRTVPIHPAHRVLQGLRWAFDGESERFYQDNFLCFGLSGAPGIFHRLSTAVARMMMRKGYEIVS